MFFGSSAVQFVFHTLAALGPRPELLHHVAPLSQGWEGLGGSQFPKVSQLEISSEILDPASFSRQGHKCTAEEIAQALCKEGDDWL